MRSEIIDAFSLMAKEKNIDRDILESVIKDSFQKMMEKKHGQDANFEVIVNMEKGNIEIFLYKVIVENIENPNTEIDIETAKEISGEDFEIGDDFVEEVPIVEFGRRLVLNLKQNLNQKIREIEKEITFNRYKDIVGDIIVGEVYQIKPNSILLIHDGNEILYPKSEWIPKERYRKGDTLRAIIKSVEKKSSGLPVVIASRGDDQFLYKLFELEIPEIYDGIIEVKAIAREPGERAKIAVVSNDDRIDAVGACVGMKGIRIHSIVRELSNENIDVINYSDDPALYIARALSPAKIDDIFLDSENMEAKIVSEADQMSLIIGRNGQNIKLASKLSGYQIDIIKPETSEDEDEEDEEVDEEILDEKDEEVEETEEASEDNRSGDEDSEAETETEEETVTEEEVVTEEEAVEMADTEEVNNNGDETPDAQEETEDEDVEEEVLDKAEDTEADKEIEVSEDQSIDEETEVEETLAAEDTSNETETIGETSSEQTDSEVKKDDNEDDKKVITDNVR